MNRLWKFWRFRLAALVIVSGLGVVVVCWIYNVWSLEGWRVYHEMDQNCHPAWQDYQFRRVRAGDPVDEVIARTQPSAVERKGRWVILSYRKESDAKGLCWTGMWAAAYDDRMVCASAASCTWTRLFFDDLSEEQCQELIGRSRDDPHWWGIGSVVR